MPEPFQDSSAGSTKGRLLRDQASARRLTEAEYQSGESRLSANGLGVTRRRLTQAGAEQLAANQSLSGGFNTRRQLLAEQRSDRQTTASTGKLFQEYRNLRRQARESRGGKSKLGGAIATNVEKIATAELLKQAWLNLIDSFGLTFLYITFHFIVRYVAGSQSFCAFGEEWFISPGSGAASAAKGAEAGAAKAAAAKGAAKSGGTNKPLSETMLEIARKPVEMAELIVFGILFILLLIIAMLPVVLIWYQYNLINQVVTTVTG